MRVAPKALLGSTSGVLAAGLPMLWLWGFTVDDACISARVAHQLALGNGYRFNPGGPVVDAVTPLGWAVLLSPFARSGVLQALFAAQCISALAWLTAAAWLGREFVRLGRRAWLVGCLALLASTPLAAWAVAGMETGLVAALATAGLSRSRFFAPALGVAAALRPELFPWAATLVIGRCAFAESPTEAATRLRRTAYAMCWVSGPCLLVAAVRMHAFGHAYPLSLLAKPSDLSHGARYAAGALLLSGPPWLLLTRGLARASLRTRVLTAALAVHGVSLLLAGGDWMPLYRLIVPVLPAVILAGAELAELHVARTATCLRVLAMLSVCAVVAVNLGPSARGVGEQRGALIAGAAPLLREARVVAALDVGWLGAATSASIVDLAGVTDPSMATLPGGHTSKRLPEGLLELRQVDALVLLATDPRLADWPALAFARAVEARVPQLASIDRFEPRALLPLRGTRQAYVVLLERPE